MIGVITLKKKILYVLTETILLIYPLFYLSPLRVFYLRILGAKIGKNTFIDKISFIGLHHNGFKNLIIKNNVFIGREVLLDLTGVIEIEDYVTIATRTIILTHTNVGDLNHPLRNKIKNFIGNVKIGYGSFIGANAIILGGSNLNKLSIVRAGDLK